LEITSGAKDVMYFLPYCVTAKGMNLLESIRS